MALMMVIVDVHCVAKNRHPFPFLLNSEVILKLKSQRPR